MTLPQTQFLGKKQNQSTPLKGGQSHQNSQNHFHPSNDGQNSSAIRKKGGDQSKGQQSHFSQQGSSKGSAPYSNAPHGGRGFSTNFNGACFSCAYLGHKSTACPQKVASGSSKGVAMSKPTVGDTSRCHRVFLVVDNYQAEHQGTIVEATGTLYGISSSILFDSGASNSFLSPSLIQ